MKTTQRISRRAALRGAGVALALPLLEAMIPRGARGAGAKPPVRLAFLYVPNGVHMPDWTPKTVGPEFELSPVLEPLRPFKDDLLVLGGLTLDPARAHGDGGGDHARAMASFLTGRHPRKTDGADLRAGISVDQVASQAAGRSTRLPSLEVGCEGGKSAGECDHGYSCAYQSNLSWRSESTPVAKEVNPRLVFDRLFGGLPGGDGDEARARGERHRKSVLDHVTEDARQLASALGASDRRKLEEYLTSVREIEQRISRAAPARDGGRVRYPRPLGIPADYQEHLRLMSDLLALAFQSDLTRVATFVFANDGNNRSYRAIGVSDGHHDLSHHAGDEAKQEKIRRINQFHTAELAYFLGRLKSTPEGDGTLLDHCMVVYGSGISDGNAHSHDELPILLAGKAGGTIKTGRHVRYPKETPLTNLYLCMLDRIGVPLDAFGDSTGRLAALDG
jgi:hypothetical protein